MTCGCFYVNTWYFLRECSYFFQIFVCYLFGFYVLICYGNICKLDLEPSNAGSRNNSSVQYRYFWKIGEKLLILLLLMLKKNIMMPTLSSNSSDVFFSFLHMHHWNLFRMSKRTCLKSENMNVEKNRHIVNEFSEFMNVEKSRYIVN